MRQDSRISLFLSRLKSKATFISSERVREAEDGEHKQPNMFKAAALREGKDATKLFSTKWIWDVKMAYCALVFFPSGQTQKRVQKQANA